MRLDRYLANSGYGSRSEVKEMIHQGLVRVDGAVCRDSGWSVRDDGSQHIPPRQPDGGAEAAGSSDDA